MNRIVLIGAGGHAKTCVDVIEQEKRFKISFLLDKQIKKKKLFKYNIIKEEKFTNSKKKKLNIYLLLLAK